MTYRDIDSANRRYFHPQMIHNKQTRNRLGSMTEMFHKTKAGKLEEMRASVVKGLKHFNPILKSFDRPNFSCNTS